MGKALEKISFGTPSEILSCCLQHVRLQLAVARPAAALYKGYPQPWLFFGSLLGPARNKVGFLRVNLPEATLPFA